MSMMDQGQHRQPQGPRVDNDDNLAGGPFNFNNHTQQDDYNSFFNNDGSPSSSYTWDPTPVIDPRIQPNGFSQNPSTWHQNSLSAPNSRQTPNYGLHSPNYTNSFSTYAGFQQQHHYPAQTYDAALSYGNPTLLEGATFDEHVPQEYERPSGASQTISPSALQSFSPYSQFPDASEEQNPTFRNGPQTSLRGGHSYAASMYPLYDDQQAETMAAILPNGSMQSDFWARDPTAMSRALPSSNLTGHVFLSNQDFVSDDPRAVLPKHSRRRSTKDLKRQILAIQGDKPWSDAHKPLAKRLKLSHPKKGRSIASGTSAASGTQTAGSETSSPSSSASGSDDDSEYDSESDAAVKDEPSPLPAARPADPKKALEFDVIKCVWSKRSAHVTAARIRTALGDYWNIIKRIRDNWKTEMVALQEAEEKKDDARAERRRTRATEQRNMMENSFRVTLQHGHPDIVEKLGEIPQLLLTFSQLVTDRFKEGDYSGPLVAIIFQFMARCTTLDQSLLERTKLDKLLPKLVKRGDEKIKSLGQQILDNVEQSSKQKPADSKSAQTVESKAGSLSTQGRASELVASVKRQRDNASPAVTGLKKGTSTSLSKPGAAAATKATGGLSKASHPVKTEAKSSASSTASTIPAKVKVNHVVAKPSVFSSLQSASKKPGTSIAAQKAAQQSDGKTSKPADTKAAATSVATAAPKPAFSFAETMANLNKPKEVPSTVKAAESGPPETEEEKKKRVRREERRKLRVRFKPDDDLVEIRLFVHDPDEELGHDASMTRDVGDISSEGRMLKMHKERELLDDDEEYTPPEEELAPWRMPTAVDFSVIDASEIARNCVSRGGKVEVKSPEKAVQEQRELTTLMAFYTSLADTPTSPREPADPYSGEPSIERMFGAPQEETKLREAQYYATLNRVPRAANPPVVAGIQTPDISALLQILNSQQQAQPVQSQQQYQMAQPQHQPPPQPNGLEAIFAQFSGNQPATPQPAAPQPVANPQLAMFDPAIQAALATLKLQNPVQQGYMAPAPAQAATPDLQALLSRLGPQPSAPPQNYNYQGSYQNDGDRKRPYDYDDQRQNERYSDGKRVRGNLGKKFYGVPSVPCKFWHEGKCKKGDECTFLHE